MGEGNLGVGQPCRYVLDKIPSFLEEARISKLKLSKSIGPRKVSQSKPYLDKIALSSHDADDDVDFWKKLLIQPVAIPPLGHTGIRTALAPSTAGEQLIRPDGRSTLGLKKLIAHSVQDDDVSYARQAAHINQQALERERSSSLEETSTKQGLKGGTKEELARSSKQKQQKKQQKKKRLRRKAKGSGNRSKMTSLQRLTQETTSKDTLNPWKQFGNILNGLYDTR